MENKFFVKIQKYVFITFLLAIPLIYTTHLEPGQVTLRVFQEHVYQMGAMILFSFFVGNIYLTAFFVLNCVLFVINGGAVGFDYVLNIFLALGLFSVSRRFFKIFSFKQIISCLLILGFINLLYLALQRFGIAPLHQSVDNAGMNANHTGQDITGIFYSKSVSGFFFALIIPILASINMIYVIFAFAGIYFSESSVAILAGTIGLLFYTYSARSEWRIMVPYCLPTFQKFRFKKLSQGTKEFYPKWSVVLVCILIPVCLLYIFGHDQKTDPKSFTSRFHIWYAGVEKTFMRPVGYGPDSWRNITKHKDFVFSGDEESRAAVSYQIEGNKYNFTYYHPNQYNRRHGFAGIQPKNITFWDNAHNEYITIFFQYGFLGMFLFCLLIKDMVLKFRKSDYSKEIILVTSMLLVFAVAGLTQFPLHLARVGYIFPILLGAFYRYAENGHERAY